MAVSAVLGFGGINLLSTALAAACLGFLVWNFYPARVFMGDTGSMFLGGLVCGLAFGLGMPLILAFLGIIYVCESLSVILQVISFKTTGRRIFRMSPIHHHFEMCGLSEVRIDLTFAAVNGGWEPCWPCFRYCTCDLDPNGGTPPWLKRPIPPRRKLMQPAPGRMDMVFFPGDDDAARHRAGDAVFRQLRQCLLPARGQLQLHPQAVDLCGARRGGDAGHLPDRLPHLPPAGLSG